MQKEKLKKDARSHCTLTILFYPSEFSIEKLNPIILPEDPKHQLLPTSVGSYSKNHWPIKEEMWVRILGATIDTIREDYPLLSFLRTGLVGVRKGPENLSVTDQKKKTSFWV